MSGRILQKRHLALCLGMVLCLWSQAGADGPSPYATDREDRNIAHGGLDTLMDGDPNSAIRVFREIQKVDPQSPLGYLLEAEANWWKIYYATANLLDSDLFDVASLVTTPHDADFRDLINKAIQCSQNRLREHTDVARNDFYLGMAYGLEARLSGLRGQDVATSTAGRKMRTSLISSLARDPNLADAKLGLGIYDYYVDTLPTPLKLLRFLVAMPDGNREQGIEELQQAAENGELTKAEAKFYLVKDYSRDDEKKYAQSLAISQELSSRYPHNPLWRLVSASMQCHLGQTQQCDSQLRQIYVQTAGKTSNPDFAVHRAARIALSRQHPNEKFNE